MKKATCCLLIVFLACQFSKAQQPSDGAKTAYSVAKALFNNTMGGDSHLYLGKEYADYQLKVSGNQWFQSDHMVNGDVYYNGSLYQNIPLMFDISRQQLITPSWNQGFKSVLLNEKLIYFTIAGHHFQNLSLVEEKSQKAISGIFDIVFDSTITVLVKRNKAIVKAVRAEDLDKFVQKDQYFIRKGNAVFAVSDKNALLEILNDKKDLVKNYMRQQKLRFKINFENDLVNTVTYYSTIH